MTRRYSEQSIKNAGYFLPKDESELLGKVSEISEKFESFKGQKEVESSKQVTIRNSSVILADDESEETQRSFLENISYLERSTGIDSLILKEIFLSLDKENPDRSEDEVPKLADRSDDFVPIKTELLDGKNCIVVQETRSNIEGNIIRRIWIDKESYFIVKYEEYFFPDNLEYLYLRRVGFDRIVS